MEKDKRYLLFEYDQYYPGGGIGDMTNSFDTLDEAIDAADESEYDYQEVYDRIEGVRLILIKKNNN